MLGQKVWYDNLFIKYYHLLNILPTEKEKNSNVASKISCFVARRSSSVVNVAQLTYKATFMRQTSVVYT